MLARETTRIEKDRPGSAGPLDGLTILRFAHAYGTGGGVEQHLADLNRALGARSRICTVQMQLTTDPAAARETRTRIGQSELITVPLWIDPARRHSADSARDGCAKRLIRQALNVMLCTATANQWCSRHLLKHRRIPRRAGEPLDAGARTMDLLGRFNVDLVVLHASGGADASEVIEAAEAAGVPVALVHHFANDRLRDLSMRQQVARVRLVGGASLIGTPRYIKRRFRNLSDAVDTEFFSAAALRPVAERSRNPAIYAPARVTPEKGQADVVAVAILLQERGIETDLVFAGRVDSPEFERELREKAANAGLRGMIRFLGQLSMEEYRDWYGPARMMLLPTRHAEGMPRTVIDSQAMGVPPIVYASGGTREGLVDGQTGFAVDPGDVAGMAQKAAALIQDDRLHRQMATEGRRFVEMHFSMAAFAGRHERFYLEALSRRQA